MSDDRPVTQSDLDRMEGHILDRIRSLRELMDERERAASAAIEAAKAAVGAAVSAQERAVAAALSSADKASAKTEAALAEYKVASNEWRSTVNDLMARRTGKDEATEAAKATHRWMIGLAIMVGLSIIANFFAP